MKQFKLIFKHELSNFFKNKVFVGITLTFVLLLAVVMFAPRVMAIFDNGEDTAEDTSSKPVMLIVSEDDSLSQLYGDAFAEVFPDYKVLVSDDSIEGIKNRITEKQIECAFKIESLTSYTYYVDTLSLYDSNYEMANQAMESIYRMNALISNGVSAEDATQILSTPIECNIENIGKDQTKNFFYAYIMILALYMVLLLYGNMVATNVATEKSSRAMELLITSAKPANMMFGKVFAACLAGLTQLFAIFGSALVFYKINREYWSSFEFADMFFDIPVELLVYLFVFFILGFLIYAFLFGAVGSTVSKLEDINTAITPIMILFLVQFFIVNTSLSSGETETTLLKACSFIPFTSPMAMFTRIALSTVPMWEIILSIVILVASVFGVGMVSAKIYRMGVLLYGTPPKPLAILKALRKK